MKNISSPDLTEPVLHENTSATRVTLKTEITRITPETLQSLSQNMIK